MNFLNKTNNNAIYLSSFILIVSLLWASCASYNSELEQIPEYQALVKKVKANKKSDFETYWSLYQAMVSSLTPPDVLIYLKCNMETLRERIDLRGRKSEKNIPLNYLKKLQHNYDSWIKKVNFCEVVAINTDQIDYVSDLVDRAHFIDKIKKYLT
jgi:deoxyadenosine/deoxycytidine kinase